MLMIVEFSARQESLTTGVFEIRLAECTREISVLPPRFLLSAPSFVGTPTRQVPFAPIAQNFECFFVRIN